MDPQPSVGGASIENGMGEFFAEEESLKFGGHDGKAGCDDAFPATAHAMGRQSL